MKQPEQPAVMPPRVWISKKIYRLVSGGEAPDAGFVEFQDSEEYLSKAESDALVREAIAKTWEEALLMANARRKRHHNSLAVSIELKAKAARGAV